MIQIGIILLRNHFLNFYCLLIVFSLVHCQEKKILKKLSFKLIFPKRADGKSTRKVEYPYAQNVFD